MDRFKYFLTVQEPFTLLSKRKKQYWCLLKYFVFNKRFWNLRNLNETISESYGNVKNTFSKENLMKGCTWRRLILLITWNETINETHTSTITFVVINLASSPYFRCSSCSFYQTLIHTSVDFVKSETPLLLLGKLTVRYSLSGLC